MKIRGNFVKPGKIRAISKISKIKIPQTDFNTHKYKKVVKQEKKISHFPLLKF